MRGSAGVENPYLTSYDAKQYSMFGTDNTPTGVTAVRQAISELEDLHDTEFTAALGEPDVKAAEGEFYNDPVIVIPVYGVPYGATETLVFDVPTGPDDESSMFIDLLEALDLSLDSMDEVEGTVVPVQFLGGNASVLWDQLEDEEEPEAEDSSENAADESVSVSETTVTAGDKEADV